MVLGKNDFKSLEKGKLKDELLAFMLGVDNSIEREILRYINKCGGVANYNQIYVFIVLDNFYCTRGTLYKRLNSLVVFKFLKRDEYKGTVFYEICRDEIEESELEHKA
jgi:Fe2+ or Zn2+ uptake regulation protein